MKKTFAFFLFLFLYGFASIGQNSKKEQIESARIAFISEKLELTPDQARLFWPLYNEYMDKKQEIRRSIKSLKIETSSLSSTDEQLKADLDKYFSLREKEQTLEKEYFMKFSKTISVRQVIILIQAEKQFTLLLLKKLDESK